MVVDRGAQAPLKKWGKQEREAGHSIRYRTSYPNRAAGTPSFLIILYYLFFIHYSFNQKAGLRPCFFAFFDGALLRYRPFYSIVKYE